MNEEKKIIKIIIAIALVILTIISIFIVSPMVSKPEFHFKTIEILDNKKMKVLEWSAGTVSAATVLALVPGDATTPLANQILRISSYFLIVIGAIFLEKILLTLTGYLAFTYLIPISCILVIIYLFFNKEFLKRLAIKLTVFGITIFLVVPLSIQISDKIENSYQTTITESIKEVEKIDTTEKTTTKENDILGGITSKIQEGLSSIGSGVTKAVKKGEKMLSDLIDTIAVFIITSCIIPILILLSFGWIIKIIFNINIPTDKYKNIFDKMNVKKNDELKE